MNHFAGHLKLPQHYKSTIVSIEKLFLKRNHIGIAFENFSQSVYLPSDPSKFSCVVKLSIVCSWDFPGGPVTMIPGSSVEDPGLTPSQGTRSHMLQLRVHMLQLKILHAAKKIEDPICS